MPTVTKLARVTLLLAGLFTTAQTIKSSNTSSLYYNAKVNAGNKGINGGPAVNCTCLKVRDAASGLATLYNDPQ